MAHNIGKPNPLPAGRTPFAADEPAPSYDNSRSIGQPTRQDSEVDVYVDEKHPRQSGYGDLGADLLNGDMYDDSDEETIAYHGDIKKGEQPSTPSLNGFPAVPIMAPKPGYAAPVSALAMPEPVATPVGQQRTQQMAHGQNQPQMRQMQQGGTSVPNTPHPLQAPMTPITPAFARPPKRQDEGGVKFEAIGQREEVPLARRGQKGDDFWRRFSMVVKEEQGGRKNTSSWLEKTENGSSTLSRMIWIIGILLLIIIGGAIGFGIYISRNSTTTSHPKALGGSDGEGAHVTITPSAGAIEGTTSSGVRPTFTVDKRYAMPEPTPGIMHVIHAHVESQHGSSNSSKRHKRASKRRLA